MAARTGSKMASAPIKYCAYTLRLPMRMVIRHPDLALALRGNSSATPRMKGTGETRSGKCARHGEERAADRKAHSQVLRQCPGFFVAGGWHLYSKKYQRQELVQGASPDRGRLPAGKGAVCRGSLIAGVVN